MSESLKTRGRGRYRRALIAATGAAVLITGLIGAQSAYATYTSIQNNGEFQLDGNAVTAPAGSATDDWDRVCHEARAGSFPSPFTNAMGCVTASNTTTATAVEWTSDGAALDGSNYNATIFTGGGSKDPSDVSSWNWKDGAGGLPDKDNLLHSFAARYTTADATPQDLLFFGSDRYDNSGDAVQGFWFFQNEIGLVGTGSGTFSGVHKNKDLLVVSDFSNGGSTSTIQVYAWDSTCAKGVNAPKVGDCADANLRLKGTSSSANCASPTPLDFCGIVNASDGTVAPWPYKDKSGNSTYLNGEFFEGGLNLTALGFGGVCFASAGSETRASTSTTSVLKDFVIGKFGVCGADLKTTPSSTSFEIGGSVTDTAAVTVSGSSSPPAPTGSVTFYVCGPTSGISSCDPTSGTSIGSVNLSGASKAGNVYSVTSASYTPTAAGDYCFAASWPGDNNYTGGPYVDGSTTECFKVTPKQPAITTDQTAKPPTGVALGTAISDSATLSGTAAKPDGSAAGGTITFTLWGPQADPANPVCTGTPVYTSTAYAVSGDGTYPKAGQQPNSFTPTAVGTYEWVAVYSGDSPNTLGVSSKCGDEPSLLFALQPSMTTGQYYYPQDSLSITVASGAGDLKGNVQFQAFTDNTCTTKVFDSGVIDKTGNTGLTLTANTTNTTYKIDGATTSVWWKVTFSSTNTGIKNVTSNCTETSTVTINNGAAATS